MLWHAALAVYLVGYLPAIYWIVTDERKELYYPRNIAADVGRTLAVVLWPITMVFGCYRAWKCNKRKS
jgi:hypothetical protein